MIELSSPNGGIVQDFTYHSSWYPQTAGGGYALMVQSPTQALSLWASSSGWQASGTLNGTPGFADPVTIPLPGAVVVNEAMSNNSASPGDMIELYNTTSSPIAIGQWYVSNNSSDLMEYQIAPGTVIAANGYYVLTQDYNFDTTRTNDPGCLVPFVFDPDGDTVYLSSAFNDFPVASITRSGTTATVTLDNTSTGFQNGQYIDIAGAAQSQYDGNVVIANLTVNSSAGTTTFTYTVAGSPASPATANSGQWITAGAPTTSYGGEAGGYQESQAIPSMPGGYAYGLYTKPSGGTQFTVASITLSGTTATVTLDNTSTDLQNGNQVFIEGAAQNQYDGSFLIANVTVNAVTTTFTYTVTGSPTSPATPAAGQSITAGPGNTNFTLLETATLGTLSGTTYSGGAVGIPYVSPLVTDEIMYDPSQPTAAETAEGYADNDFEYLELYNPSSSPVSLSNYYVTGGVGYTPGWLADGNLASEFPVSSITHSGTTATVTLNGTSTGLQNGDQVDIGGAAQSQYDGDDFVIGNVTVNSGPGTTTFTYTMTGSPASSATPLAGQVLSAGKDEFETLESGATATWSASSVASGSYTVYAHLNLYDGDNNLLTDLDSSAQYTVTCGGTPTTVTVDQDQVPATLSVTSLTYSSTTGLATATAANTLSAGNIIHISAPRKRNTTAPSSSRAPRRRVSLTSSPARPPRPPPAPLRPA